MKKEEILKYNPLIAKFMGYEYETGEGTQPIGWYTLIKSTLISDMARREYLCRNDLEMKYHSSWDWLMPVVSKIESISQKDTIELRDNHNTNIEWQFSVEIQNNQCMIHRDCTPQYYGTETDFLKRYDCRNTSKILSVYESVVEFIKWYNLKN